MNARSEILQKIKELEKGKQSSLIEPGWEEEELLPITGDLIEVFKKELNALGSECFVVETFADLPKAIQGFIVGNKLEQVVCSSEKLAVWCGKNIGRIEEKSIENLGAMITLCEGLVAQTASVVMSSQLEGGRKTWAFPPVHIVVATQKQLFPNLEETLSFLNSTYGENIPSQITLITGASRTADIEKTLVKGAHGPVQLVVFILKEEFN